MTDIFPVAAGYLNLNVRCPEDGKLIRLMLDSGLIRGFC